MALPWPRLVRLREGPPELQVGVWGATGGGERRRGGGSLPWPQRGRLVLPGRNRASAALQPNRYKAKRITELLYLAAGDFFETVRDYDKFRYVLDMQEEFLERFVDSPGDAEDETKAAPAPSEGSTVAASSSSAGEYGAPAPVSVPEGEVLENQQSFNQQSFRRELHSPRGEEGESSSAANPPAKRGVLVRAASVGKPSAGARTTCRPPAPVSRPPSCLVPQNTAPRSSFKVQTFAAPPVHSGQPEVWWAQQGGRDEVGSCPQGCPVGPGPGPRRGPIFSGAARRAVLATENRDRGTPRPTDTPQNVN